MKTENEQMSKCRMVAICIVLITRPVMCITCRTLFLYDKTLNRLTCREWVGRATACIHSSLLPLVFLPSLCFLLSFSILFFLSVRMSLKKNLMNSTGKYFSNQAIPKQKILLKCRFWFNRTHFKNIPWWCLYCWSVNHNWRNKMNGRTSTEKHEPKQKVTGS